MELNQLDKIIGENLRTIRQLKGLTQQEVGDIFGVTFQQVQKYESAKNRIAASKIALLAKLWNVPLNDFYERTGEMAEAAQFNRETLVHAKAFSRITRSDIRHKIHLLTLAVNADTLN